VQRYLVRYGVVPEVARFRHGGLLERGDPVIVRSSRGLQLGTVLERELWQNPNEADGEAPLVERRATAADFDAVQCSQLDCEREFLRWSERISEWGLALELIDLEWTIDRSRLILYVLTERGADATKLALQAAAAGIGPIEVQPIAREGLVPLGGHGCGTGGCGCQH